MKQVKTTGTGSYAPETRVTNKELESLTDTKDKLVYQNFGVKERRVVRDQLTSDLAAHAALKAFESANIHAGEIDLLIVATDTHGRLAPSTA